MILVFSRSCLHAVSSLDGEVIWKIDLTENRYFICGVGARFYVLLKNENHSATNNIIDFITVSV